MIRLKGLASTLKRLEATAAKRPCPVCGAAADREPRHPIGALFEDFRREDARRALWYWCTSEFPRGFYSDLVDVALDVPLADDERKWLLGFGSSCARCGRCRFDFARASNEDIKRAHVLVGRFAHNLDARGPCTKG